MNENDPGGGSLRGRWFGEEIDIAVHSTGQFDTWIAIGLCKAIEPSDPLWIEDPVWPEYKIALVPLVSQAFHLFAAPFGPQPALPNAARTLQITLQTLQSEMPRTTPVPEFLYESQWPASAARSGSVAVVIVQHAVQAVKAHTQAALSPRFAGFQYLNPQFGDAS